MTPNLIQAARWGLGLTIVFIIYATTIPFEISGLPELGSVNWTPLWDSQRQRIWSIPDMVQNVAFFLPFGFFLVAATRLAERPFIVAGSLAAVVGGLLSTSVEFLQTMSPSRIASTTDVVTNAAGAWIGGASVALFLRHGAERTTKTIVKALRSQPGLLVLGAYLACVIAGSLAPFLPSLDVGLLRASVRRFLDHPLGTKPLGALVPDLFIYAGLCFVAGRELRASWGRFRQNALPRPAAFGLAAAGVIVLAIALEGAQFIIKGHSVSLSDVVMAALGAGLAVVVGSALGRHAFEGRSELGGLSRSLGWLVLAWFGCSVTFRALSPLDFVGVEAALAKMEWTALIPFAAYIEKTNLSTVTNAVDVTAHYAPIGWLLAARGQGKAVAAAAGAVVALCLEGAQLFVTGRVFDATEALFAGMAAAGAAWALHNLEQWRQRVS